MGKARMAWALGLAALVAAGGCNRDDADRLARVGRNGAHKAEGWVSGATGSVTDAWPAGLPAAQADAGLASRVSARIKWDASLSDLAIEVEAKGAEVELRGTVNTLQQRRRAMDLASSTVGVEKVNDLLVPAGQSD